MDDNRLHLIREALRHAEAKQSSMLTIALAADARAMSLSVACAGLAGILVGVDAVGSGGHISLVVIMTALTFFCAAGLAAYAARPINFSAPGQDFSDFVSDLDSNRPLAEVLVELGGLMDDDARDNAVRLARNASFLRAALFVAAIAPLVGLLVATAA